MKNKSFKTDKEPTKRVGNRRLSAFLLLLTVGVIGGVSTAKAQSIINATGGNNVISGDHYAYSIGEMAVIGTADAGSFIVTQGLLQPEDLPTGINDVAATVGDINLYPNPTSNFLTLQPDLKPGAKLSYTLYDLSGRRILKKSVVLPNGKEPQQISLEGLASGTYLMRCNVQLGASTFKKTIKIQKLK